MLTLQPPRSTGSVVLLADSDEHRLYGLSGGQWEHRCPLAIDVDVVHVFDVDLTPTGPEPVC
jgi:hypothetical protein